MGAYVPMLIMAGSTAAQMSVQNSTRGWQGKLEAGMQDAAQGIANQYSNILPATPATPILPGAPPPPPLAPNAPQIPEVPSVPVVDLNQSPQTLLGSSLEQMQSTRRKNDDATVDRYRALTTMYGTKSTLNTLLGQ